ncbi:hypothetical protein GCM10027174_20420 [Salinifilum aidingensis]
MGKGNGFNAPTEAIDNTGQEIKGLEDKAGTIKDKSSEAEVADTAWGVVGLFVKSDYDDLLQQVDDHLDQIKQGIADIGDKLTETAKDYDEVDRAHQDAIQQVEDKFTMGGKA